MTTYSVLILDENQGHNDQINKCLEKEDLKLTFINELDDFPEKFEHNHYDAIVIEYFLSGEKNGIDYLKEIRKKDQFVAIIMTTKTWDQDIAIEAIRNQSDDFLIKPINYDKMCLIIHERIAKRRLLFSKSHIKNDLPLSVERFDPFENFVILRDSMPIFMKGRWGGQKNEELESTSDDTILLSSFLSAMQALSSSIFGMSMSEIALGDWKILFQQQDPFLCAIKVNNKYYNIIKQRNNKRIVLNTLLTIISGVKDSNPVEVIDKKVITIINTRIESAIKQIVSNQQSTIKNNNLLTNKIIKDNKVINKANRKSYFSKLKFAFSKKRSSEN